MRPKSIVNFERLVLLYLAIGLVYAYLVWDQTMASLQGQGAALGSGTIMTIQAVTVALYLLLVWFISRKGSPVAKWIYVVISGLSLVLGLVGIQETISLGTLPLILAVAQYALILVTIWLLFRPDSKAWFNDGRGGVDSDTFR
jgi:glucan phosphoethanolaminetransferase (alkaline phosphatase superfamily)